MKFPKILLSFCCLLTIFLLLPGCESKKSLEDQLADSWYQNGELATSRNGTKGPLFTLYSDGTCELAWSSVSGTWSLVNDDLLKLTTALGDSQTATIISLEDGCLTLSDGYENYIYYNTSEEAVD